MSWNNGFYDLSITGTLADLFTAIRDCIATNTDFELTASTDISLTYNTKIANVVLTITDSKITDASSTTTSNTLSFTFSHAKGSSTTFNILYFNTTITATANNARVLKFYIYTNANIKFLNILAYNSSTISWSTTCFGAFASKKIIDDQQLDRYFLGTLCYPVEGLGTSLNLTKIISNASAGIVMINQVLVGGTTSSSKIMEYCPSIYNCSSLTAGYEYQINSKSYFAIDSNILVAK